MNKMLCAAALAAISTPACAVNITNVIAIANVTTKVQVDPYTAYSFDTLEQYEFKLSSGNLFDYVGPTFGSCSACMILTGTDTSLTFGHVDNDPTFGSWWLTLNFSSPTMDFVDGYMSHAGSGRTFPYYSRSGPVLYAAIPEPATWAMLVGGFAMAGAAMRRQKPCNVRFI